MSHTTLHWSSLTLSTVCSFACHSVKKDVELLESVLCSNENYEDREESRGKDV